jgi:hypothetical protein
VNFSQLLVKLTRSLLLPLTIVALSANGRADDWAPNLTASAIWHSNATQANRSADQLDSLDIKGDILASQRYPFGRDDSLHLGVHLGGDWWPRYNGLLSGAAGGRIEWRHKFGVDTRAPIVALEGTADSVAAKETGRRGVSTGITASVRKRLNDLTRVTLWHEVAWFDARYSTYDRAAGETAFEIDRDLTDVTRLTFTARFRDGDVVTYAAGARPDLEALAPHRLEVTTFGRAMMAYRVDAKTWSARLALVRALDESSAIVFAYERRETERGSLRFGDHLLSVGLVHQF